MVWCLSLQSIFAFFFFKKGEKEQKKKKKKSYHEIEYIQKKIVKIKGYWVLVLYWHSKFEPICHISFSAQLVC